MPGKEILPIETLILTVRGRRVMRDSDLAKLYGVTTGNLNKAVARNPERFPDDFMFQLSGEEAESLIFQFGISKAGRGGRRFFPYVFTQEGIAMLSSVLRSPRAIEVNVTIMRAFVGLRRMALSVTELAKKVETLERGFAAHGKNFTIVFDALRELMTPPEKPRRRIGFHGDD